MDINNNNIFRVNNVNLHYTILKTPHGGMPMYRTAIEKLYKWKKSRHRKPLIIEGARQVGKNYYTNDRGSCEVDFVVDISGRTVPVLRHK